MTVTESSPHELDGYRSITVTPISPNVGAEIGGVDIAGGVSDEQFTEIRRAFADHGVIFFRDQDITPDQHIAFAERWAPINVNRFFKAVESHPQIAEVRKEPDQKLNIGKNWHTDHSYDQVPAMGSVLYAREVPPLGGDTLFAGMAAAYEELSEGLQAQLLTMRAEHTSRRAFGMVADAARSTAGDMAKRIGNPEAATQDAVHPVVIKHPLSGRPCLYVNTDFTIGFEGWTEEESAPLLDFLYRHATQDAVHPVVIKHPLSGRPCLYVNTDFTIGFEGWTEEESAPLLDFLYRHATQDHLTCRFKWSEGSMAIWDNRAVQHKALNDYHGHRRLMHRITLDGVALGPAANADG